MGCVQLDEVDAHPIRPLDAGDECGLQFAKRLSVEFFRRLPAFRKG